MKKNIIAIIVLLFSFLYVNMVYATADTWTAKANYGGTGRSGPVGFSIGIKGYIGTGYDGNGYKVDFWEYDPTTDVWSQKANLGCTNSNTANCTGIATGRYNAVGFSIGSKGYIGTGATSLTAFKADFYEYDPATNAWSQKANLGCNNSFASNCTGIATARTTAVGFSIGTKGYIGTGGSYNGISMSYYQDFYEYDPSTNKWTKKANYPPTTLRGACTGFSIGSKGYIGTGAYGSIYSQTGVKDFYEYNPSTDTWTQKADFQGTGRAGAAGFSIGSKGYIGLGKDSIGYVKDFWEYDPSTDTWTQKTDFGGHERYTVASFSIGSRAYIGAGYDGTTRYQDFYEYEPATMPPSIYSSFGNGNGIWQWDGNRWTSVTPYTPQAMVTSGTNLYVTFGNGIWKWDGSNWTQITICTPKLMAADTTNLYGAYGKDGTWKWNGSAWSMITRGSAQVMVTSGTTLYGAFPNGIWKWDGSTWTQLTSYEAPQLVVSGTNLYTTFGSGNGIWKWNGSAWSQVTPYSPQAMVTSGTNLYVTFGNGIWKWNGSTWSSVTSSTPNLMAANTTTLYATFGGNGIWQWDGTFWIQITPYKPSFIVAAQ